MVMCCRGVLLATHTLPMPRSLNCRAIPLPNLRAIPGSLYLFPTFTHLWHHFYSRMATNVGKTNLKWSVKLKYKYFPPWEKKLADLNQVRKMSLYFFFLASFGSVDDSESFFGLFLSLPHNHLSVFTPDFQGCRTILVYYSLLHYVKSRFRTNFLWVAKHWYI